MPAFEHGVTHPLELISTALRVMIGISQVADQRPRQVRGGVQIQLSSIWFLSHYSLLPGRFIGLQSSSEMYSPAPCTASSCGANGRCGVVELGKGWTENQELCSRMAVWPWASRSQFLGLSFPTLQRDSLDGTFQLCDAQSFSANSLWWPIHPASPHLVAWQEGEGGSRKARSVNSSQDQGLRDRVWRAERWWLAKIIRHIFQQSICCYRSCYRSSSIPSPYLFFPPRSSGSIQQVHWDCSNTFKTL